MSPRRKLWPFTRISVSARACRFSNWPLGRTKTRSSAVVSVPAGETLFCAPMIWPICVRRNAEAGELRVRDLDVDALIRVAEIIDLADVGHAQQLFAQLVGVVVQLGRREAITFERIDIGVDVAELVVEERPLDTGRQRGGDVAHFLAHLVPRRLHLAHGRRVFHREEQERLAGARVAAQEVDIRRLLQLAADTGRSPRPRPGVRSRRARRSGSPSRGT